MIANECGSWTGTSVPRLRVKCQREVGHQGHHHHEIAGPKGWTCEWPNLDAGPSAAPQTWDGTAAGANPIIDWLLSLDVTAAYDDPEGREPLIRINVPAPASGEYLFAGGSVAMESGRPVVTKPPLLGSARAMGLTLGDVLFIANSKAIRFPGVWGYRADDPVMTPGGPIARCAWNWTLGGAREQRLLVAEIRRRGYEVLESERGIE